jgi:hypothetical protein
MVRWASLAVGLPVGMSAIVLLLASVIPFRLEYRNFPDLARTERLGLPRGVPYVFVSADMEPRAYRFATFVLHGLAWPRADFVWLVPAEVYQPVWWAVPVSGDGRVGRPGRLPTRELSLASNGVVLYDDEESRRMMGERLPGLRDAPRSYTLPDSSRALFLVRPPHLELTAARLLRFAGLLALPLGLWVAIRTRLPGDSGGTIAGAATLAVLLTPCLWIWLSSLSQLVPIRGPDIAGWGGGLVGAALAFPRRVQRASRKPRHFPQSAATVVALGGVVVAYLGIYLLKLDFDEDAQAHWLLQARSYYETGSHDSAALAQHNHAARYPFGYSALLSLAAWGADVRPPSFMQLNPETGLSLALYRTGVGALHLSFLGFLAWSLSAGSRSRVAYALVGTLFVAALFPILQGHAVGVEIILFPLLGGALVASEAAGRLRRPELLVATVLLSAAAAMTKLEGGMLAAVAVGPWFLSSAISLRGAWNRRFASVLGIVFSLALVPVLLWRLGLSVPDTFYRNPSVGEILRWSSETGALYRQAATAILRGEGALLVLVIVPAAFLWRFAGRTEIFGRAAEALVPVSIAAAVLGFPLLYAFSTRPQLWHLAASYERLLYLPVLSGAVYCLTVFGTALEDPRSSGEPDLPKDK